MASPRAIRDTEVLLKWLSDRKEARSVSLPATVVHEYRIDVSRVMLANPFLSVVTVRYVARLFRE